MTVPDPGIRTQFRRALQDALEELLELPFEGGIIEGPQTDREVGCVWWEGKRPHSRDGNMEDNFYRVRVLRRFRQDQGAEEPRTTTAEILEQTAEQLEDALRSVLARPQLEAVIGRTLTDGHDFFTVVEVTTNYLTHSVEAQITAYARNRSAAGG